MDIKRPSAAQKPRNLKLTSGEQYSPTIQPFGSYGFTRARSRQHRHILRHIRQRGVRAVLQAALASCGVGGNVAYIQRKLSPNFMLCTTVDIK